MKKKMAYSLEVKEKVIELKIEGKTTKEILELTGVKSKTQIDNWWGWYRKGEIHRFHRPMGKPVKEEKSEIEQLKEQLRQKELEIHVLKKLQRIGKEVVASVVIQLVEELKSIYKIKDICKVLTVAPSTYYRWKAKAVCSDPIEKKVGELCKKNHYTYGYRKITALIRREEIVNSKKIQRIMQANRWNCRVRIKKAQRPGTAHYRTKNHLARQFQSDKPYQKLVTDVTYLPYGEKMLYLSSIMDLYNGEIVAFKISDKQTVSLAVETLEQLELPKGVLLHSDQGSIYTSYAYYQLCKEKGIIRSMSRKGMPADNAPIECFHSSLKCETFYLNIEPKYSTTTVIDIVTNYIKNYNTHRIQRKLGYLSPIAYRKQT
ncbi:IS3 family transposase, partial [Enterococcus sp. LJL128]